MKIYEAPSCLLLSITREDVLSLSLSDGMDNELTEYGLRDLGVFPTE